MLITLELVKFRIGLNTTVMDNYLLSIIDSVKNELHSQQGIDIDESYPDDQMFLADYTAYRYLNRDEPADMPRHLQYRLHNLYIKKGGKNEI